MGGLITTSLFYNNLFGFYQFYKDLCDNLYFYGSLRQTVWGILKFNYKSEIFLMQMNLFHAIGNPLGPPVFHIESFEVRKKLKLVLK